MVRGEIINVVNVVVSFPARNEEDNLPDVLDALQNQTLKPLRIVIANDGSTDRTEEIARSYDLVEVHNREKREGTVVGKIEMSKVWNSSITPVQDIHKEHDVDYIVFLGGDIILPPNYIQELVIEFEKDPELMIAAGKMVGEHAYTSTGFMVPGPGRMMRYEYWLELGGKYPEKQGWESYPVYRAQLDGFKTGIINHIEYTPMRPTGGRTDYHAYGQAMKALGYSTIFAIGRMLKQPFLPGRSLKASWNMMRGFFFSNPEKYEPELREFIRKYQLKRLKNKLWPF